MKKIIAIMMICITAQTYAIIINNGTATGSLGYYAADVGYTQLNDAWIGTNGGNVQFIYSYKAYYSKDNGANETALTVPAGAPATVSNTIVNTGTFVGNNGNVDFVCESWIPAGEMNFYQKWTFKSANPFGTLRFYQYLDEDVLGSGGDLLVPIGSFSDGTLKLYTIDEATRIGTYHSVLNNIVNTSYIGWSADKYSQLISNLGTAQYLPEGYIDTASLPKLLGSTPPEYGPADVTSAIAFDLNPASTQAVITTIIAGTVNPRLPADSFKINSLKASKKGFSFKAGYNWSGSIPPETITLIIDETTNVFTSITSKGKGYVFGNKELGGKLTPKKHSISIKGKGENPVKSPSGSVVKLKMASTDYEFSEKRDVQFKKSSYKETKQLTVPLFYIEKMKIKTSKKAGKSKISMKGVLSGESTGTSQGALVRVNVAGKKIFEGTIPVSDLSEKKGKVSYKRKKGGSSSIKKMSVSIKKKSFSVGIDGLNLNPGADGEVDVTIRVGIDTASFNGGGTVSLKADSSKKGIKY